MVIRTNHSVMYKAKVAVCSDIHTKHSTQSKRDVDFSNVKTGGKERNCQALKDNTLGGSVHTIKKNVLALGFASKKTGLQVNADNTRYMVMY